MKYDPKLEHLVYQYLDGQLTPDQLAEAEAMLQGSSEMRNLLVELKRIQGLLQELPVEAVPAGLSRQIQQHAYRRPGLGLLRIAAAVGLMIGGGLVVWMMLPAKGPIPPQLALDSEKLAPMTDASRLDRAPSPNENSPTDKALAFRAEPSSVGPSLKKEDQIPAADGAVAGEAGGVGGRSLGDRTPALSRTLTTPSAAPMDALGRDSRMGDAKPAPAEVDAGLGATASAPSPAAAPPAPSFAPFSVPSGAIALHDAPVPAIRPSSAKSITADDSVRLPGSVAERLLGDGVDKDAKSVGTAGRAMTLETPVAKQLSPEPQVIVVSTANPAAVRRQLAKFMTANAITFKSAPAPAAQNASDELARITSPSPGTLGMPATLPLNAPLATAALKTREVAKAAKSPAPEAILASNLNAEQLELLTRNIQSLQDHDVLQITTAPSQLLAPSQASNAVNNMNYSNRANDLSNGISNTGRASQRQADQNAADQNAMLQQRQYAPQLNSQINSQINSQTNSQTNSQINSQTTQQNKFAAETQSQWQIQQAPRAANIDLLIVVQQTP